MSVLEMGAIDLGRLEELRRTDPAKAELAETHLARIREAREANPLLFFRPHPKQNVFLTARTSIKAFLGGNRSGKTTAGIVDDLVQAVDGECLPDHLKPAKRWDPPFHCRIVTPDFTSTMEGVVFEKLRELAPKAQLLGGSWEKAYDKQNRKLRFANGSWFSFMTFEQDLDKFGGAALHRNHYDEEPPEPIRKECQARLIDHGGDEVFTMTPLLGMTWMYDGVFERRHEDGVTVVQVATDDNAQNLNMKTLEEFFSTLTPDEVEARRKGRFVVFGGLVLALSDENVVDAPAKKLVQTLDNYVVIDPGAAQGAVLFGGFDQQDRLLCYDELYPAGRVETLVGNLAAQVDIVLARWGLGRDDVIFVIDPSARNAAVDGGEGVEAAYWMEGIYPIHGKNDRFASVMQMRRRAFADPPMLFVSRECLKLLWELGRWRVAEDETEGRKKRGRTGDTFATQGPDHLGDTLRYLCMERTFGPVMAYQNRQAKGWQPNEALPAEWFEGRPQETAPMGAFS